MPASSCRVCTSRCRSARASADDARKVNRYPPTTIAPTSSQTNPNIATRESRRVPDKLSEVVAAMSTSAITVVATGELS